MGDLSGHDHCPLRSHQQRWRRGCLPLIDQESYQGSKSDFLLLIGRGGLCGRSLMTDFHPTSCRGKHSHLFFGSPRYAPSYFPGKHKGCTPQGSPDSDLGAGARSMPTAGASRVQAGLCFPCHLGGGGGRRAALGAQQSHQGDFSLEAGGAACIWADAAQHGDLSAARGTVNDSRRVLVFGV